MIEAWQDHKPRVAHDAFVHHAAVVIGNVVIGNESSVWPCVTMRGDDGPIVIGQQTSIQDNAVIHMTEGLSTTTVGDRVTVGHGAILHGCAVENDCLIGMGSIILDNAIIESGCIVGAGAMVPPGRRIPAGSVVIGNPLTVLRMCHDKDIAWIEHSWRAYVRRGRAYRQASPARSPP